MRKTSLLAAGALGTILGMPGCGVEERKQGDVQYGHSTVAVVENGEHHNTHEAHRPSFEKIAALAEGQRKEYESLVSIADGRSPAEAFGDARWAEAIKGGYAQIVVCSDERNVPPAELMKIGVPGAISSDGVVRHLKNAGMVKEVGWHEECAANGSSDEKSQAMARNFAIGVGLPVTSVKSFGFSKGSDYRMRGLPEYPHYHPAKALGINAVPDNFHPGKVHNKLDRFDVTIVGQTPEELRKQVKLLIDVAMTNGDTPEERLKMNMPFVVYAAGHRGGDSSIQNVWDTIDPIKGPVAERYGKDAVRYVGIPVPQKAK